MSSVWLTLVGIGEEGWDGLNAQAQNAVRKAVVLFGGERHLAMIPPIEAQVRQTWPSPFSAAFDQIIAHREALRNSPISEPTVCVLASGDPMHYGVGASLVLQIAAEEMCIFPAPSSFSLAAARLGWRLQDVVPLTVHGRPLELVHPHLHVGAQLLILSENGQTPNRLAGLLTERGFGPSRLTVLEHMGGSCERRRDGQADQWPEEACAALNVVAVTCLSHSPTAAQSCLAGLPDSAYRHDGQLTKRDVRAVTLARLAPCPRELLWDVGAGCGSIGIEWMRTHPSCRAVAIEANSDRQSMIRQNAAALGVPGLMLVAGKAPEALTMLESPFNRPDAIFIGGGLTIDGVFETCWQALKPGGRLVVNAVTVQSEALLAVWKDRIGGELTRFSVSHACALGKFDAWRPAMPVTILSATKPT
ncbi:Precorrin-6Y C(5,15)-methyltransferase (decarboxylating) [Azospirillaceae bacterium]